MASAKPSFKLLLLVASLNGVISTLQQPHQHRHLQDNLAACLRAIPDEIVVVTPDDSSYSNAVSCHNSARTDRSWSPRAVVQVTTPQQVAAAVQCAASSDITVTPRSGAHGFENEACSGELIVDVSKLDSLAVNTDTKVVEFGSGHVHGQLYGKLLDYGLVVPGGTENSVGTGGLWLGCGRGPFAQVYGLSCDNVLAVEFVDANGNLRVADSSTDTDMFWMARGGGGEFPGVVTKFTVQAYDMPSEVHEYGITFRSDQVKALVKEWSTRIDELSDPSRSMFTNIHTFEGNPILSMTCFSCSADQKEWLKAQMDAIASAAGGGTGYDEWAGGWVDRLLKETWDDYNSVEDLFQQSQWPAVWTTLANGAHMVPYTDASASDEMLNVMQNVLESNGNDFYFFLYSMSGSRISNVGFTETAYGGREAKYVVHYKWVGGSTSDLKAKLWDTSLAFDQAGLPCKGFYNYAARELPCAAGSGDLWLEAHFSDVPRMKSIKQSEDPDDRFLSALKAEMWKSDSNEPPSPEPTTSTPTSVPTTSSTPEPVATPAPTVTPETPSPTEGPSSIDTPEAVATQAPTVTPETQSPQPQSTPTEDPSPTDSSASAPTVTPETQSPQPQSTEDPSPTAPGAPTATAALRSPSSASNMQVSVIFMALCTALVIVMA